MSSIKIRWEKQANHRYYEIHLARDLFGWCLTRVWGRQGTALGQIIHRPCDSYEEGLVVIEQTKKQRHQKQYQLVSQVGATDG